MKKIAIIFVLLVFGTSTLFAQDPATDDKLWKVTGINQLSLNQVGFANWAAGGTPSIASSISLKWYARYKKEKISWDNNMNVMYGLFKEKNEALKKQDDLLDLNSIFGYEAGKKWDYSLLMNFKTQFSAGYDDDYDSVKISNFMAPGFLTLSPAMRWKPTSFFYILLSPITMKSTFVLDQDLADIGAFGVDPAEVDTSTGAIITSGSNTLFRYGAFVEIYFGKEVAKGLAIESKINSFYAYNDREGLEAYDMDINWETFINYSFNKYFSVSAFVNMIYLPGQPPVKIEMVDGIPVIEAGASRQVQWKETFGFALTYNFANFEAEE